MKNDIKDNFFPRKNYKMNNKFSWIKPFAWPAAFVTCVGIWAWENTQRAKYLSHLSKDLLDNKNKQLPKEESAYDHYKNK